MKGWEAATRAGSGEHFIRENFLSRATLQMLQCMRRQFVDILRSAGFLPQHSDAAGKVSSEAEMLGGSAANENSSQHDVIVSVVAAGLYPNVVSVGQRHGRPSMRPPKLTVRGIGRVELHPKSALAGTAAFPQPYLVYGTLVRSSACFVHDASCVPIMALMLFGGTLSVKEVAGAAGAVAMTADSWLTLHVAAESAACVMALTRRLHHCLQAKFTTPSLDMYAISLPSPVLIHKPRVPALSCTADTGTAASQPSRGRRCVCCAAVSHRSALLQEALLQLLLQIKMQPAAATTTRNRRSTSSRCLLCCLRKRTRSVAGEPGEVHICKSQNQAQLDSVNWNLVLFIFDGYCFIS